MKNIIVSIGPPRCGTTSLYHALVAMKEVAVSRIKEPRFFAEDRRDIYRGLPLALRLAGNYRNGMSWHDRLFKENEATRYRIDFTTYYSITEETPALLRRHYPKAKLIFIMRDPIERFVSHYYLYIKMGFKLPDIREVIEGESAISKFLFSFCFYSETYDRYARMFGSESICVLKFPQLYQNPSLVERRISEFLQLEGFVYRPSEEEKNKAGLPKWPLLQRLIFSDCVKRMAELVPPAAKIPLLTLRRRLVLVNRRDWSYPELGEDERLRLRERLLTQIVFYNSFVS